MNFNEDTKLWFGLATESGTLDTLIATMPIQIVALSEKALHAKAKSRGIKMVNYTIGYYMSLSEVYDEDEESLWEMESEEE
tara:strand:+ start:1369 stop:1611 length:243 start_codon:yes stop_codon:yes gene_type:complete